MSSLPLDDLRRQVVGRSRELELVVAGLQAGRHMLLEGPPGTGKSTLLRRVAETTHTGFVFVEGNAELTPGRLVGHHDPSQVLEAGYRPEVFVDGPLVSALRSGSLLYLEELNRVPEETLNVLVTVMAEGELHVPRLGTVIAADGFRLVAAMNPFDAIGTARVSSAIYDRMCRVAMGYQSADDETEIVRRAVTGVTTPVDDEWLASVVRLVRATRTHADVRTGSSVRGAIDLVLVASALAALRRSDVVDGDVCLDAALTALSGRIRLHEGTDRSPDDIVRELWQTVFGPQARRDTAEPGERSTPEGKAPAPTGAPRVAARA